MGGRGEGKEREVWRERGRRIKKSLKSGCSHEKAMTAQQETQMSWYVAIISVA